MAYVPVATKSDGDILTAAFLNQLADNAQSLAGLITGVNLPFLVETTVAGGNFTHKYRIKHLYRYFHYLVTQDVSTSDNLDIKYDGTTVYNDGGDRVAPYTWSGYVDLDSTPGGLTIGDYYEVYASVSQKTGSGVTSLLLLGESPGTTL